MENRNLDGVPLDPDGIEHQVIGSNPVLTLITTEDGIPTSTEVTVLTTSLGDIPLMTTLGTLAEVPLTSTTATHSSFLTHSGGVRTVYATPQHHNLGSRPQVVISEDGRVSIVDSDGIQRTLVVHAANHSQLASALTHVQVQGAITNQTTTAPRLLSLHEVVTTSSPHQVLIPGRSSSIEEQIIVEQTREEQHQQVLENMEVVPTPILEEEDGDETVNNELMATRSESDVVGNIIITDSRSQQQTVIIADDTESTNGLNAKTVHSENELVKIEEITAAVDKDRTQTVGSTQEQEQTAIKANSQPPLEGQPDIVEASSSAAAVPVPTKTEKVVPEIPQEVVCLVCYQAFLNPKRGKKETNEVGVNESDHPNQCGKKETIESNVATTEKEKQNLNYGRTLGNFFELSRVTMSILIRRSYKDYEVPICQSCNKNLILIENIIKELRKLERELCHIRQNVKEEIVKSFNFFKNSENKELAEGRKNINGLLEILEIVDRIRGDIINDGRPPKTPLFPGKRRGRKPKSKLAQDNIPTSVHLSIVDRDKQTLSNKDVEPSLEKNDSLGILDKDPLANTDTEQTKKSDCEDDSGKDLKPAIRTSFGRVIKRPAYMMMSELTADELSDLGESSEDNYEEIEVKPDIPVGITADDIENPVQCESFQELMEADEEDPSWHPGKNLIISDKIGLPVSSSGESEMPSDYDSDQELTSKTKVKKVKRSRKKEPKDKKRKAKTKFKKRRTKKSPNLESGGNYEVKVIQLDGTELMTINTTGPNDNIGLEPEISQKVMDSQAVIMVKNQLFGKRVECNFCSKTFTDPGRRDIHVKKKHEGELKPFACDVCSKRFGRQDHLRNHMKRHTRPLRDKPSRSKSIPTEKNHSCHYCDQRFRNKSELAIHTRLHTGERPFKCEKCTEAFVSALKREFHIEQMHPEVPPIRCQFCPKGFFRQHRLRLHAVSHTREKTNICEICGKSFTQAAMLRYHQTMHEELNLKQFKCQECNRVFANPQNLKSHMESQHQKMYRHRCDTCGRGYTQMSHLRRHMRTHSGEQPFGCNHCPKKFTSGAALKIHVRIHTGERPYWCSQCEKGFRSKTKLGRHMKTLIHAGGDTTKLSKKDTLTPLIEFQNVDVTEVNAASVASSSVAPQATWTEIVGIITGV